MAEVKQRHREAAYEALGSYLPPEGTRVAQAIADAEERGHATAQEKYQWDGLDESLLLISVRNATARAEKAEALLQHLEANHAPGCHEDEGISSSCTACDVARARARLEKRHP